MITNFYKYDKKGSSNKPKDSKPLNKSLDKKATDSAWVKQENPEESSGSMIDLTKMKLE